MSDEPKFSVGDEVNTPDGDGQVVKVYTKDREYSVSLNNGDTLPYGEEELTIVIGFMRTFANNKELIDLLMKGQEWVVPDTKAKRCYYVNRPGAPFMIEMNEGDVFPMTSVWARCNGVTMWKRIK